MKEADCFSSFKIENNSPIPLYEQIKGDLKLKILSGKLQTNQKLLPIREYSKLLKVNPNTVVKVYYQLLTEGFIYSKQGQGYFVKKISKKEEKKEMELFKFITDEYVKNVTDLGFSIDSIINRLQIIKKSIK